MVELDRSNSNTADSVASGELDRSNSNTADSVASSEDYSQDLPETYDEATIKFNR